MGDGAFFKTLQAMCQQYAWKSISTDEFQKAGGDRFQTGTDVLFRAMGELDRRPPIQADVWSVYRTAKGYQVMGKITQDLDLFPHAGRGPRHYRRHEGL
jgi:hypothetical protein